MGGKSECVRVTGAVELGVGAGAETGVTQEVTICDGEICCVGDWGASTPTFHPLQPPFLSNASLVG
jgi:hypothetical protein